MSFTSNSAKSWDETAGFRSSYTTSASSAYLAAGSAASSRPYADEQNELQNMSIAQKIAYFYADDQGKLQNIPIVLKVVIVVSNFFNEISSLFKGLKKGISSFFWALTHQQAARREAYDIKRWMDSSATAPIKRPTTFEAIYEVSKDRAQIAYYLHKATWDAATNRSLLDD